ncbi:MAG: BatA domain-containing protein [Phycisphaerae bacterium]
MLLAISFVFGGVLWGATAAAAPVVIHLIMRTKPRRMPFPALQFVRKTHKANISKLKLKHLILLAMRMLAVALVSLLIARAFLADFFEVPDRTVPAAAVVIVDNSASMTYRTGGKTLLSHGKQMGRQIILRHLPEGSRYAVLSSSQTPVTATFLSDPNTAAEQLNAIPETYAGDTLTAAMQRAFQLLQGIDMPRKEVFVISDMTEVSWSEMVGVSPPPGVSFTILNVGPGKDTNIALGPLRVGSERVPVGVETSVETTLSSAHLGGQVNVHVEMDGQAQPKVPVDLPVGGSRTVKMLVRASNEGTLHGKVVLDRPDPLAMDNVRYFSIRAGRTPTMIVVSDKGTTDKTGPLVSAASAFGRHSWVRREPIAIDHLSYARIEDAAIVLLPNIAFVSEQQWKDLERFVREGGRLWVVAGSLMSADAYNASVARKIMPVELGALEELPEMLAWAPRDYEHPLLHPFRVNPDFPLTEVKAKLRFTVTSTAEGSETVVPYADGVPAIVERTVGDGAVLLWNFSPLRGKSDIAPMFQHPLLAQGVVRAYTRDEHTDMDYTYGGSANVFVPRKMGLATAAVRMPGQSGFESTTVNPKRVITIPAEQLGHWDVQLTGTDAQRTVGFSVNAPARESDLAAIDANDVGTYLPGASVQVVSTPEELVEQQRMVHKNLDLVAPILLALLVLMTGEAYFANRFYKRGAETAVDISAK